MERLPKKAIALFAVLFSLTASPAFAVIDTTAALAEVTDAGTALAAVGGAILVLAGISLAYRWVKATFF